MPWLGRPSILNVPAWRNECPLVPFQKKIVDRISEHLRIRHFSSAVIGWIQNGFTLRKINAWNSSLRYAGSNVMNKVSRLSLSISLLYSLGLLIHLVFPDPYTPLVFKIPALLFMFSLLSIPSVIFYAYLNSFKNSKNLFVNIILLTSSLAFPALWMVFTPAIIFQTHADALVALYAWIVPLWQTGFLIMSALIAYFAQKYPPASI